MSFKKLFFLVLLLSFKLLCSQQETFKIKKNVTDKAEIFTADEQASLERKLSDFEAKTTNQVVVVTITSLEGAILEEFANDFFKKNEIGRKNKDNGVLLLIAKEDRKLRIEVGYGLEPLLTDAKSSRIIREVIAPEFKQQNFFKGVNLGLNKIISTIDNSFDIKDKEISTPKNTFSFRSEEEKINDVKNKIESKVENDSSALNEDTNTKGNSFFKHLIFTVLLLIIGVPFLVLSKVNFNNFKKKYPKIINLFRGFLVGKVAFSDFLTIFILNSTPLIFVSGFLAFLGFLVLFLNNKLFNAQFAKIFIENIKLNYVLLFIFLFIAIFFVLVPFIIAFFNRKQVKGLPLKFLFSVYEKSNNGYLRKYLNYSKLSRSYNSSKSRGYSSSGSSSFPSYSSSNSTFDDDFSGGGGGSGGGGASGDW